MQDMKLTLRTIFIIKSKMNNIQTQLFIACTMFGTIGLILSLLTFSVYDYYKKQKAIRSVFERLNRIG
jgi:hypothetical protein